ncbi:hypothetical protein [Vibrio alfacsensis]|uniref:hypothetical protein n=1 Tax=Vibrio alfacsensis TaxID=1074311 RepID=UPI0040676F85
MNKRLLAIYVASAMVTATVLRLPLQHDSWVANILVSFLVFTTAIFAWLHHKEKCIKTDVRNRDDDDNV